MSAPRVKANTPAGRLFLALDALRNVPKDAPCPQAFNTVFGLQTDDWAGLLRHLAQLSDLIVETRALVESLPDEDDPETVLAHYSEVEGIVRRFSLCGNQQISWLLTGLTDAGMLSLRMASSRLSWRKPEPTIDGPSTKALLEQARSLMEDVTAAEDLDEETRAFILKLLQKIEKALEDFRFLGVRPVESSLNETAGALRRKPQLLGRLMNSKVAEAFGKFITALDLALNLAANAVALTGGDGGGGASISPVIREITMVEGYTTETPSSD